jgi:hypothetical protein
LTGNENYGFTFNGGNFLYASWTLGLTNYGEVYWFRSKLSSPVLLVEQAWQLPIWKTIINDYNLKVLLNLNLH